MRNYTSHETEKRFNYMRVGVGGLLLSACLFFCCLKSQIRSPDAILPDYVICNNLKFT